MSDVRHWASPGDTMSARSLGSTNTHMRARSNNASSIHVRNVRVLAVWERSACEERAYGFTICVCLYCSLLSVWVWKREMTKKNETKKSDVEIWCCCCCRLCSTLFSFFLYSDNDERTKKKRCWQISFLCLSLNSCARLKLVLCLAWSPNTSRMHTH